MINNTTLASTYILGDSINLSYTVVNADNISSPITEGIVEFYKYSSEVTQLLGYLNLDSNGSVSFDYKLTSIGNHNFKGVFKNNAIYNVATSSVNNITVNDKLNMNIINKTTLESSYKLGTEIELTYELRDANTNEFINDGCLEITKKIGSYNNEIILGYANINGGNASFTHKFIESNDGQITFIAKYKYSIYYSDNNSVEQTTTVYKQYNANLSSDNNDLLASNKLGNVINLKYKVVDDQNEAITEGIIEIHKVINLDSENNLDSILEPTQLIMLMLIPIL